MVITAQALPGGSLPTPIAKSAEKRKVIVQGIPLGGSSYVFAVEYVIAKAQ